MLVVMNLASDMMAAVSSRPSFLIFQFLSPILDTRSELILSLILERGDKWIQYSQVHLEFMYVYVYAIYKYLGGS